MLGLFSFFRKTAIKDPPEVLRLAELLHSAPDQWIFNHSRGDGHISARYEPTNVTIIRQVWPLIGEIFQVEGLSIESPALSEAFFEARRESGLARLRKRLG